MEQYKKQNFPNNPTTRCYIKCFLEMFRLFDAIDGFKTENLMSQLTNGPAIRFNLEQCADISTDKTDACTWAYKVFMCLYIQKLPIVLRRQ